ncbi:MAG: hypothetical protein HYR96_14060 [Deltaproteobacteria bacterium]|nr:hypothetical protein [Deltaproteobacteria bacterium]
MDAVPGRGEGGFGGRTVKVLYATVQNTIEVLWQGYEQLTVASDKENQAIFQKQVSDNAKVITTELASALKLMREKRYHILEEIKFVNELGNVAAAIDTIMKGELGSDPGFLETLQTKK